MTGAHLANQIRAELDYAHWPQSGNLIHSPVGHHIWGPLGQEDVCPNFSIIVTKFVLRNSGNFRTEANLPSPGLALNAHSGNDWGQFPKLTGSSRRLAG